MVVWSRAGCGASSTGCRSSASSPSRTWTSFETSVGTEDRGGVVALTDLGVWAVQRMASVYLDAPVVGALVDVAGR
jgi:hypothetical protein